VTHVRLWRFRPPPGQEAAFVASYGPDGDWARLFSRHDGFQSIELWRGADGTYLTADRWVTEAAFERFQRDAGETYRELDERLEGRAGEEHFLGAYEVV
jgi:heme-degrading monooxygenase HmoA